MGTEEYTPGIVGIEKARDNADRIARDAHGSPVTVKGTNGGSAMESLTRQQRKVLAKQETARRKDERSDVMKRLSYLQGPVTRGELFEILDRLQKEQWDPLRAQDEARWSEMRVAFNQLSVRLSALMRAVLARRVWGKPLLADIDYERALVEVEAELRAQAEAAASRTAAAPPSPPHTQGQGG